MNCQTLPQIMDDALLRTQLKNLDMKSICGSTEYMSMSEILSKINITKSTKALEKQLGERNQIYTPPGGWKEDPNLESKRNKASKKAALGKLTAIKSIARFREFSPKWDRSSFPDHDLHASLYRIPCRDPSGTLIRSVIRDDRCSEFAETWLPTGNCKDVLPEATHTLCSKEFSSHLLNHIDKTVRKTEQLHFTLPAFTEKQRNIKSRVGADLNNLQRTRLKVLNPVGTHRAKSSRSGSPKSSRAMVSRPS